MSDKPILDFDFTIENTEHQKLTLIDYVKVVVKSRGKLTMEDLSFLSDNGVPAYSIFNRDDVKNGHITYKDFDTIITEYERKHPTNLH